MISKRIIICLKDGVLILEVLPHDITKNSRLFKRLYDMTDIIQSFRQSFPRIASPYSDDEKLFSKEIYPQMTDIEKKLARTYVISNLSDEDATILFNSLQAHQGIEYVVFDELNVLYYHPNDHLLGYQWAIAKISCEPAWDISQGDNIVVAVIDSGVDYNHPDIAANMWKNSSGHYGYDFSNNDADPKDSNGHGTHVAGTIAAVTNNNLGIAGAAPKAKIMAVKILPNAFDTVCAQAIKYAADNGARVLNNSWGPPARRPSNPVVEDAVSYAFSQGAIIVFAAGNNNDDVQYYSPANHPKVISVAATDHLDRKANFSNYGQRISIAAPGVGILSLKALDADYIEESGTSMAAPHVSGVAALMLRVNEHYDGEKIKYLIQAHADQIDAEQQISKGRINAFRSVLGAKQAKVIAVRVTFHLTDDDKDKEEEIQLTVTLGGAKIGYGGFGRGILWKDPGSYPCTISVNQPFDPRQLQQVKIRMYKTPYGSPTGNGMEGRIECHIIHEGNIPRLWFSIPERRYGDNNPYDVTFP